MAGQEGSLPDIARILELVQSKLREAGIDADMSGNLEACCNEEGATKVKVVCVPSALRDSMRQMEKSPRGQVVMVRVDQETNESLDAWVATGAVKSRSEAAALFIREGLKVRADELERLRDALRDVRDARDRLRRQAKEVFGLEGDEGKKDEP